MKDPYRRILGHSRCHFSPLPTIKHAWRILSVQVMVVNNSSVHKDVDSTKHISIKLMYFILGDIVGLGWLNANQKASDIASGIVSRVTQTAITVAFDETTDSFAFDDGGPFKLIKLANDITHKRIKRFAQKDVLSKLLVSHSHMR